MNTTTEFEHNLNLVLSKCEEINYTHSKLIKDDESSEYGGYTFELNTKTIIFRTAKITPTKVGQFVTAWKRNQQGITEPYHSIDGIDFYFICTKQDANFGMFVFSKELLIKQGILSTDSKEGKRGFRVYPPWDVTANTQAIKTQKWQLQHFINFSEPKEYQANFLYGLLVE